MANRRTAALSALLLATLLLATGCTLGPDPTLRPVAPIDGEAPFVNAEVANAEFVNAEVANTDFADAELADNELTGTHVDSASGLAAASLQAPEPPIAPWWEGFADPVTAELVTQALEANHDLGAAVARLAAAEAGLKSARSSLWPRADLNASASRSKSSFVLPQTGRVGILSTTYLDELAVSYQVDLFGRLARTRQASWAELLAARDARETVEHAIVASVVRSRVTIAVLEQRLELARSTLTSWEASADFVGRRYDSGLADALDVRLVRQSRESARAAIPSLEAGLARARHALDVLLGRPPGRGTTLPELRDLPPLEPPPVGLPVALLDRRPDVRAAERSFQAATARVGVALANLFPTLNLTGGLGNRSDDLSDLLSSETIVYNAVAGLAAPLFAGGKLRADVELARARVDEATALYAGTVLTALREVEDALVSEGAGRARHAATEAAAQEAREGARLARDRYERGTGSLLAFLEAERRRFATETQGIDAREAIWVTRIDLHLALGGDWSLPDPDPDLPDLPDDSAAITENLDEAPSTSDRLPTESSLATESSLPSLSEVSR